MSFLLQYLGKWILVHSNAKRSCPRKWKAFGILLTKQYFLVAWFFFGLCKGAVGCLDAATSYYTIDVYINTILICSIFQSIPDWFVSTYIDFTIPLHYLRAPSQRPAGDITTGRRNFSLQEILMCWKTFWRRGWDGAKLLESGLLQLLKPYIHISEVYGPRQTFMTNKHRYPTN